MDKWGKLDKRGMVLRQTQFDMPFLPWCKLELQRTKLSFQPVGTGRRTMWAELSRLDTVKSASKCVQASPSESGWVKAN